MRGERVPCYRIEGRSGNSGRVAPREAGKGGNAAATPSGSADPAAHRAFLGRLFADGVRAVDPAALVRAALSSDGGWLLIRRGATETRVRRAKVGAIHVVGGGKAGRAMAEAAVEAVGGRVAAGAVAVPPGHGGSAGAVRFMEAGHPLPDAGSADAADRMLSIVSGAGVADVVIAVLSGGGSAMIAAPAPGIGLADKAATSRLLLGAGADVAAFNSVRKHLSRVKGGRMARAAAPARVLALLLSDVPGDDPSVIASGPFSPDPTTYGEALSALGRLGAADAVPAAVRRHLESGRGGRIAETPKAGDAAFERVEQAVVGANVTALDAVAAAARREGIADVRVLPGFLSGEARECAKAFAALLRRVRAETRPGGATLVVAGGETTVRVAGPGRGGRNQEFALAAALELSGVPGLAILCAGTDGVDGPTDAAGACADGDTLQRAGARGLSAEASLAGNDSHTFFRALGDLVVTGPTGTNVADIAIGWVGGDAS